jgi:hypothetical protein
LIIININGETDPEKLRAMHHLIRLDKQLLALVGRKPWHEGGDIRAATAGKPVAQKTRRKGTSQKK